MRGLTVIFAGLLSAGLWLVAGAGVARADPLDLRIQVDLTGIAHFTDHPSPDAIVSDVTDLLHQHISDYLYLQWHVTDDPTNTTLLFRVRQHDARRKFDFLLEFRGDDDKGVSYRGEEPESVPRQGAEFDTDLIDAVYEFLYEKGPEIEGASAHVHAESDDALDTLLHLDRPLDDESRLRFRSEKLDILWDRIPRYMTYEHVGPDRFDIPFQLRPGETRSGQLRPQIVRSHEGELPVADFCISRPDVADPSDGSVPEIELNCPLDGTCALNNAVPSNWAEDACRNEARSLQEDPPRWAFGAAFAATPSAPNWNVPPLDVLFDRIEQHPGRFVGFTEFKVENRDFSGLDADAFTVGVFANGVPIHINGEVPGDRLRRFDPARGLSFRFGLENLKFAGRDNGCERLDLQLRFYRDGEPVGDDVVLTRDYAALRHAPERFIETQVGTFSWTGTYVAPGNRNETAIFLASALYRIGDDADEDRSLAGLNDLRMRLDERRWTIRASELGLGLGLESVLAGDAELAIVGKLRPPRTVRDDGTAAYGLLVGVEEPSGQLQFTFDGDQQRALAAHLAARRATDPEARSLVPTDLYIYAYSEERRTGPDWVCRAG
ncbi:hypothetical protein [Maritimibacter dapengensis]|uniref:Uncharacterized protein n=1 Tax=Maritimibacter dapengensis TaxID=2836868 RepID=A0ABS6SXJ3_9RHOB|nr:hypothetical protein [Maritimibacter dapengensis]MBV7377624.1 hypothetical protein [Maritimibacter dapengensis]